MRCLSRRDQEGLELMAVNSTLKVCDDETCNWNDDGTDYMTTRRWYPTLETLEDGTMIIVRSFRCVGMKRQLT